jgi:FAD synthetase
MSLKELVSNYVGSVEQVLKEIKTVDKPLNVDLEDIRKVIEYAKAYLGDAKYYREKMRFEVSLAAVAYCEGLLDALKLLGAVMFEWPAKKKNIRER